MVTTMVDIRKRPRLGRVRLSLDRKVTPFAVQKGERLNNEISRGIRNTFGLPSVISCSDGMTKFCDDCYASSIEDIPSVSDKMWHNWMTFKPHLDDSDELLRLLEPMVAESVDEFERANFSENDWIFRHFWDGDVPSVAFFDALVRLADCFSDVQFWVYTRSFGHVWDWMLDNGAEGWVELPDNFSLYFSVDRYNVDRLKTLGLSNNDHCKWQYAFCADTFDEAALLAESIGQNPMLKCPEQTGRYDLVEWTDTTVTERGKRVGRGACASCRWCVDGRGNVQFAVHPEPYKADIG